MALILGEMICSWKYDELRDFSEAFFKKGKRVEGKWAVSG